MRTHGAQLQVGRLRHRITAIIISFRHLPLLNNASAVVAPRLGRGVHTTFMTSGRVPPRPLFRPLDMRL
eukprot:5316634-Prymnesium_polylepis.2